jgi:hypothetical protein
MSWLKAFFAGVIGAACIAAILGVAIGLGFKVLDFSMMWGTFVGLAIGPAAWIAGFGIHLLVGGLFALVYAAIFKAFSGAGAFRGGVIGVVHAIIAGLAIAFLPLLHPLMISGRMTNPGPYFSGHGLAGILFFFGVHMVYGVTVGWLYARWVPAAAPAVDVEQNLHIAA